MYVEHYYDIQIYFRTHARKDTQFDNIMMMAMTLKKVKVAI